MSCRLTPRIRELCVLSALLLTGCYTYVKGPAVKTYSGKVFVTNKSLPQNVRFERVASIVGNSENPAGNSVNPLGGVMLADATLLVDPEAARRDLNTIMADIAWRHGANAIIDLKVVQHSNQLFLMRGTGEAVKLADPNVPASLHLQGEYVPINGRAVSYTYKAISLPQSILESLSGYYQFSTDEEIIVVRRDGNHLVTELRGAPALQLYPIDKEQEFFDRSGAAQIAFGSDTKKNVKALVLHQSDKAYLADRVDEAYAHRLLESLNERVAHQTPAPGSSMALHHYIDALIAGSPDYDRMGPGFSAEVHAQLANLRSGLLTLGALRELKFEQVRAAGTDVYKATFERGTIECQIRLGADGKIVYQQFGASWANSPG